MNRVKLNTKDNSMADGKKSIRNFYEELITEAVKYKKRITEHGTIIDDNFINLLINRLNKLNIFTLNDFQTKEEE
tara:strand:+ start:2285 stop:2509 length:225 start_codon:yes stop_codon:yes gene_type:complete